MRQSLWSKIRDWVRKNPHAWWVLYLPFYLISFFLLERVVDGSKPYWVSYLPLDDKIPFVSQFVVLYCMWYPLLVGVGLYLLFKNGPAFTRYMQFIAIGFTASILFCLLVPNGQDLRPASFSEHNVFTALISGIYHADTNTNVFPSVHVVGSVAALFAFFDDKTLRRFRFPAIVLCAAISISTVFIKQHSVLDIFGAIVLCIPIWAFLAWRKRKENVREKREKSD